MSRAVTGQDGCRLYGGFDLHNLQVASGLNDNAIINSREVDHVNAWNELLVLELLESNKSASINLIGRKIVEDGHAVTEKCKVTKNKNLYFVQVGNYDYKVIGAKYMRAKRV